MNVEYVGRNYDLDDRVREYAEEKLQKVVKFLEDPVDIRVTLESAKHRQIAELHIAHRHGQLQATEATDEMLDAVNLVVDKVEKQARRSRKKFIDTRRRADRATHAEHLWPVEVLEGPAVDSGSEPRIIKTTQLSIKPMRIEEAALALGDSKNEFMVFRDASTDRVAVLYRRRDGNYGLITPEI